MRELAWIALETEAPPEEGLMSDEQFEDELALAREGRWSELDLDELPDDFMSSSIEDLRAAGS